MKVEGKGVCRHIDLMTHNHGSNMGNTATFPFLDGMIAAGGDDPCKDERQKVNEKCSKDGKALKEGEDWTDKHCDGIMSIKPRTEDLEKAEKALLVSDAISQLNSLKKKSKNLEKFPQLSKNASMESYYDAQVEVAKQDECLKAKKCELVHYNHTRLKLKNKNGQARGCCHGQTGHHVVPNTMAGHAKCDGYDGNQVPVICAEGFSHSYGSHKDLHEIFAYEIQNQAIVKALDLKKPVSDIKVSMSDAINSGAESVIQSFPESECSKKCIEAQLEGVYKNCKKEMTPVGNTGRKWGDGPKQEAQDIVDSMIYD